ncbi:TRAF3-interacting protein 1 [Uranotaenia lowii]|uniref:TRAF3-interacting protein 1 n=1 Tax=Uranotaenia lowii TaxID=190385 RepID=UPI00247A12F2|nr:TRAF3-interacting protein 1 [Uranotaenia lowii]
MSELDPAIVKKTQTSLGKYVKKPALTDKLLKKPPFRFLHDIINVVIKETEFFKGLYTPDELVSDNIKDRDAKIAFLQKLVDVTKSVTGRELKVRPSKVVAGLEPEKTNELLQAIGYALDNKLDSAGAIQSYLKTDDAADIVKEEAVRNSEPKAKDEKKEKVKEKTKEKEKPKDKEKEKSKDKPKDKIRDATKKNEASGEAKKEEAKKEDAKTKKDKNEKTSKTKDKEKNSGVTKVEKTKTSKVETKISSDRKKLEKSRSKDKEKVLKRSESIKEEPQEVVEKPQLQTIAQSTVEEASREPSVAPEINGKKPTTPNQDEMVAVIDEEAELRRMERNSSRRSSLKKQNSLTASENNALADLNQFNGLEIQGPSRQNSGIMAEPIARHDSDPVETIGNDRLSAKPPINRQQSVDSVMRPRTSLRPPSVRPPSARPGAPRRKEKNVEIILQPNETAKLGEINVKMEVFNNDLLDDDGENLIVIEDPTQTGDAYSAGTADKMDEVKEEQEQGHLVQQILETQKEFSNIAGPETGSMDSIKKVDNEWSNSQRQSSERQMETLRESIQKLTRSVNPLGKLMDFLQEDIDSMERELSNWQQIYSRSIVELNKERSANENAIEPLKHQLAQIETNIKEYRDQIDDTRANILQNEQKIERLYMTEI